MTNWKEQLDGTLTAKIGRYVVTIHNPQPWSFWRGDNRDAPCHVGPGERRTVSFRANRNDGMSSSAFTLAGAKALAEWAIQNGHVVGYTIPDNLQPAEELEQRRIWDATVAHVNATYGEA